MRKSKEREARLKQEHQKSVYTSARVRPLTFILYYRVKMTTFRKSMDSLSLEDLAQEVTSFEQGKV